MYLNTDSLSFRSGGERVAAWLTRPDAPAPHPVVVLVHGGGAVHDMKLPEYEQAFAAAGLAVLAFDYRHFGGSGGEPRQVLSVRRQLQDVAAAVAFARGRPDLDPDRVALWGTSFGANHVLVTASRDPRLAAAVVQCPIVRGRAVATASGVRNILRLAPVIAADLVAAATRRGRRYVPIAARPGERGFVTQAGAHEGWHAVAPAGSTFENRVAAASALGVLAYDASRSAPRIACPTLVCVSDHETLIDVGLVERTAARIPRAEVVHVAADHFEVYFPPVLHELVATQVDFLQRTLSVPRTAVPASPRTP